MHEWMNEWMNNERINEWMFLNFKTTFTAQHCTNSKTAVGFLWQRWLHLCLSLPQSEITF